MGDATKNVLDFLDFPPFRITFKLLYCTLFTNIILLWIRNFEKNRTTPTPKKPKKRLMDFHDGITFQRFGLEGWDLVQYKSLKVIQNGGKSKKSKTFFVASPIEDLDSFYQKLFPE